MVIFIAVCTPRARNRLFSCEPGGGGGGGGGGVCGGGGGVLQTELHTLIVFFGTHHNHKCWIWLARCVNVRVGTISGDTRMC